MTKDFIRVETKVIEPLEYRPMFTNTYFPCGHERYGRPSKSPNNHECELELRLQRIEELLHSHGLFHLTEGTKIEELAHNQEL
jgi:hypothetical protein